MERVLGFRRCGSAGHVLYIDRLSFVTGLTHYWPMLWIPDPDPSIWLNPDHPRLGFLRTKIRKSIL